MRRIQPLGSEPMDDFDKIVAEKQEPRQSLLRALRPRVEQRMALYRSHAPHLERIPRESFEDDQRSALAHCYDGPTDPLARLKVAIQDNFSHASRDGSARCPYCGINAASTIDHYLPSSVFPELAVCHLNMLPVCGDCNRQKSTRWHRDGERPCVHFYFDTLPADETYLHAEITLHSRGAAIAYDLRMSPGGDAQAFALYQRHCTNLKLIDRFTRAAVEKLGEIRNEIAIWGSTITIEQVRACVLERLAHQQRRLGNNHWETALWYAVSQSRAFMDWCLQYARKGQTTS